MYVIYIIYFARNLLYIESFSRNSFDYFNLLYVIILFSTFTHIFSYTYLILF